MLPLRRTIPLASLPVWLAYNFVFFRDIVGWHLPRNALNLSIVLSQILLPFYFGSAQPFWLWYLLLILLLPLGYIVAVMYITRDARFRIGALAGLWLVGLTVLSAALAPRVGIGARWLELARGEFVPALSDASVPFQGSLLLFGIVLPLLAVPMARLLIRRSDNAARSKTLTVRV